MRSYERVGEKLRLITSDVLNCAKKVKSEDGNQNVKFEECPASIKNTPNTGSGENNFPVLNLGGATHFTINFNINSGKE